MKRRGFTLAELALAATITSVCLAGVYGLLSKNLRLEARLSQEWSQQRTAAEVCDSIAGAIEQAVQVKDALIQTDADPDGHFTQLSCWVAGSDALSASAGGFQRRQYRWGFTEDSGLVGVVQVRTILCGGRQMLPPGDGPLPEQDTELWDSIEPLELARGVQGVTVQFRDASDPNSPWGGSPTGSAGNLLAKVRVTVGSTTVERLCRPRAGVAIGG